MKLVSIAKYKTEFQAQIVKSRLSFEGIMCHLTSLSLRSPNSGRFELFVIEQDVEDALKILELFKEEPLEIVA